jgi:hypothetical protein
MGVLKRKGPRNVEPERPGPTMTETSSHLSIRASLTGLHAVDEVGPTELRGYLPTRNTLIGHSQTLVFACIFISFVVWIHGRLLVRKNGHSGAQRLWGIILYQRRLSLSPFHQIKMPLVIPSDCSQGNQLQSMPPVFMAPRWHWVI